MAIGLVKRLSRLHLIIRRKFYVTIDYYQSLATYILSPYGWRADPHSRIRELSSSTDPTNSLSKINTPARKIAIFVAYATHLTHSNRAYLNAFKEAGWSILYVNNSKTRPCDIKVIRDLTWRAYDRKNIGRDFGAFKDAILMLQKEGYLENCELLAILNDSMFFIPGKNADNLLVRINYFALSSNKGLFSHVSNQVETHYQSYFQILKPEIFKSKAFYDFWKAYLPLSHRDHCIYKGEIALSSQVYRKFSPVEVLYTSNDLVTNLIDECQKGQRTTLAEDILRMMPSTARTIEAGIRCHSLTKILEAQAERLHLADLVIFAIGELIENSNPSHMAAFLYPYFLECPLVKHDLCVGGTFSIGQATCLFKEILESSLGATSRAEIIKNYLEEFKQVIHAKGVPMGYSNKPRESAQKGISSGFVYPNAHQ